MSQDWTAAGDGDDSRRDPDDGADSWREREEGDGSLTGPDGSFDRERVVDAASSVLDRWNRDRRVDAVRGRVRNRFVAFALVAVATWLFDPQGLAGFVFQVWWLASLPLAAVTGAIYVTLRNPDRIRDIWWDDGAIVTLGLVLIAMLARAATTGPAARVAWQLLFGEDSPTGVDYGYDVPDDGIDETRVAELRRYVDWAVYGSGVVVLLDLFVRFLARGGADALFALLAGDGGGTGGGAGGGLPGVPELPGVPTDPLSVIALLVAAVVVGAIVGVIVALQREL